MKIITDQPVIGFDGEPAMIDADNIATVKWCIQKALNMPIDGMPWTPDEMLRCAELSRAAYGAGGTADYSRSDADYILARSLRVHVPLVHVFLTELFDDEG